MTTARAAGSLRTDLTLLRERRFSLLFAGRTIAMFGNAFGPIAIAFGVLGLPGASPATLSVVLIGHAVPQLGLILFGGVIGDRLPRYRVLVLGQALSAAAFGGMAAMLLSGWAPLVLLTGCAFLAGTASALLLPALASVVPEVVARDRLQPANALLRMGSNSANIAGLAGAGAAVALLGPGVALAVDAAAYLVAAGLLAGLRPPPPAGLPVVQPVAQPVVHRPVTGAAPAARHRAAAHRAAESWAAGHRLLGAVRHRPVRHRAVEPPTTGGGKAPHQVVADLREGFREFASRQWLWVVVVSAAFLNAGSVAAFGVLGPALATERLGGAVPWSIIMIGYTGGMLVSVLAGLRLRPERPLRTAALITPLLAAPILALGVAAPLVVVVLAACLAGAAFNVFGVLWETTLQRQVPTGALARVISCNYLVALSLKPVGILLAGHAAASLGAGPAMLGVGGVLLLAGLAALASPQVRRLTPEGAGR